MNKYTLLLNMPMFIDIEKREAIIYERWCEQFEKLTSTFSFLAETLDIEETKSNFPIRVDFQGIEKASGIEWIDDDGDKATFTGYLVYVTTDAYLEDYVLPNHIYIEDRYRNDFFNSNEFCVLEGGPELTEKTKLFLEKIGIKNSMGLLDLYSYPSKILELKQHNPSFLIIDTTLLNAKGISELIKTVKGLNYKPKKIFFLNEVIPSDYPYEKIDI